MVISYYYFQNQFSPRVNYVFDFINNHPYCNGQVVFLPTEDFSKAALIYGEEVPKSSDVRIIKPQKLFFSEKICLNKDLVCHSYQSATGELYSVEMKRRHDHFLIGNEFGFDWIETIFFHLSRYEEFFFPKHLHNNWDSMPESEMMLIKSSLEKKPVVDDLVEAVLQSFGVPVFRQACRFRVSHDIDHLIHPFPRWRDFLSDLKIRQWKAAFARHIKYYDDLDFLEAFDSSEKVIYLHMGGKHPWDGMKKQDNNALQILTTMINKALELGYQPGFHPSFMAASDLELFLQEKEEAEAIFGKKIFHSRQHYLHFDFSETIRILEKAGVQEDSSMGYNLHNGFRCGTAVGFYLYDFSQERQSSVKEAPLVWMDSAQWFESGFSSERFMSDSAAFFSQLSATPFAVCNFHNHYWQLYRKYGVKMDLLASKISNKKEPHAGTAHP